MTAFEWELQRINWAALRMSGGRDASAVPDGLRALAAATTEEEAEAAYWRLDNRVVIQSAVFQAAEYVIPPLIQILCTGSTIARRRTLELLIQLTGGAADYTERELGDEGLSERCRERAREGLGLVYWLVTSQDWETREAAIELLDYIERDSNRLEWMLQRVVDSDPQASVNDLAARILAERGSRP